MLGKLYRYIGPGPGHGELHCLVMKCEDQWITWGNARHTWAGSAQLFAHHFRPANL